eukprot:4831154-Amphidinium_carterae.2
MHTKCCPNLLRVDVFDELLQVKVVRLSTFVCFATMQLDASHCQFMQEPLDSECTDGPLKTDCERFRTPKWTTEVTSIALALAARPVSQHVPIRSSFGILLQPSIRHNLWHPAVPAICSSCPGACVTSRRGRNPTTKKT